jgi:hypothetical protein
MKLKEFNELEELQVLFTVQKGYLVCIPSIFRERHTSLEQSGDLEFVFSSAMRGSGGLKHTAESDSFQFDTDDVRSKFLHRRPQDLGSEGDGHSEYYMTERYSDQKMESFDYFKSPTMKALDDSLGNILSQIREIECEIAQV